MKTVDIGLAYQIEDDWFFRVLVGPFKTKEEADTFAALVDLLDDPGVPEGVPEEPTPPPLGVNVSETIATKDKFG